MPLYEFACEKCHQTNELLVRRSEDPVDCPACGSKRMKKVPSVSAAPASGTAIRTGNGAMGADHPLPMAPGCGAPRCCGGGCDL